MSEANSGIISAAVSDDNGYIGVGEGHGDAMCDLIVAGRKLVGYNNGSPIRRGFLAADGAFLSIRATYEVLHRIGKMPLPIEEFIKANREHCAGKTDRQIEDVTDDCVLQNMITSMDFNDTDLPKAQAFREANNLNIARTISAKRDKTDFELSAER